MDLTQEEGLPPQPPDVGDRVHGELDRRIFHLKTLYDVSKDIFGNVEVETILRNFLLMTMGNFGVIEGFILTLELPSQEIPHFLSMGFPDADHLVLENASRLLLLEGGLSGSVVGRDEMVRRLDFPAGLACVVPLVVSEGCLGLLGLGDKLSGERYGEDDRELLLTLVNNLIIALRNARSFEEIKRLNDHLQEKNVELENTLRELQAALRKVEILEGVKANLSKFVPSAVSRLMDASPAMPVLEARERDVSVLFLDIEGYTRISEKLGVEELNQLVEVCFSVFMDAIYENNGDVLETAGDGLMVLFMNEDHGTNALEAVRAATAIRERTALFHLQCQETSQPLVINIGINSGSALVGASKFESYTGSRWTFTARGMVTNVAARVGALARGGAILLSPTTAGRVKGHFPLFSRGRFSLKNVSEELEIFELLSPPGA